MFLQAVVPTVDPASNVFGITPTTVYGVLAGILFLAVSILGRLYIKSHDRIIEDKDSEIKKLEDSIDKLVDENRDLHQRIYTMGTDNIKTLEKFGSLLESFLAEHRNTQRELMSTMKELTVSIHTSVEFYKKMIDETRKQR